MGTSLILAAETAASITLDEQIRLSIMNFLEFAIWGAWYVVLGNYLDSLGFSRKHIGRIYATIPIGAIISPMFVGTIADRYFASEQCLGVLHLAGAAFLLWMAYVRTPRLFFWVALVYAILYSPTLALSNAVIFANMPPRDFPYVRVLGTIGWIAAGLSLKLFIRKDEPVNNRPLLLAAVLSLILGAFSFFLPHTPPNPAATGEIPFLKALRMFSDPSSAAFLTVSFLITIALAFYYSFTALFLEKDQGVRAENVGPVMTLGQWVEIIFMFSLPWFLDEKNLGMKWVLGLGMAAWGVRYAIFAARGPFPLILLGIALHGICFDFFFAAGMIHTEEIAATDIKASAQSLFAVLTYGLGMYLGTEASGWLNQFFTREEVDPATGEKVRVTNWTKFWLVPCAGVTISLVLFLLLFEFKGNPGVMMMPK